MFTNPQVVAREMAVDVDHPALGRIKALGSPIKLSSTPTNPARRAPLFGEHTTAVLVDYGFSVEEIALLRKAGAIV